MLGGGVHTNSNDKRGVQPEVYITKLPVDHFVTVSHSARLMNTIHQPDSGEKKSYAALPYTYPLYGDAAGSSAGMLDLRRILRVIRRRWVTVLLVLLLVLAAAAARTR